MERRERGVECNPRPMPRKYCELLVPSLVVLDRDTVISDRDRFVNHAGTHRSVDRPHQPENFEHREQQHRPETISGEKRRDCERAHRNDRNKPSRTSRRQRSMCLQLENVRVRARRRHCIAGVYRQHLSRKHDGNERGSKRYASYLSSSRTFNVSREAIRGFHDSSPHRGARMRHACAMSWSYTLDVQIWSIHPA
jgi:hypothetical protein